jgi:thiosulfate dehydrogenase
MRRFVLGLILGLLVLPFGVWCWLRYGHPPVAVNDPRLPFEEQLVSVPLHARIDRDTAQEPVTMAASPANLLLGAEIYRSNCASCHGLYGLPSSFGPHMFPKAPQLWAPHADGVVGVSDDPAGETYWKVKNGIRLSGMPSYAQILNAAQMGQVSVLLASAASPLPAEVLDLLKQPLTTPSRANAAEPSEPIVIPVQPVPSQ